MHVRHQFWPRNVPFLLLPRWAHPIFVRGDPGGSGIFVTTKRAVRAMKVVVIEKRKGFLGMVLRRIYGIRKIEEA